jgi:hypothetical protein
MLVDQASTCGTIVEGQSVGGHTRGGSIFLHDGADARRASRATRRI